MDNYLQPFGLLFSTIFCAIIAFRIKNIHVNNYQLYNSLKVHFNKDDIKIMKIERLTFKEKIRYGVVPIDIFRLYNYYFGVFTGKLDFNRKVSIKDVDGQIGTSYLSITFKNKQTFQVKEYDFYLI
jgi:hypothetical protein